MSQFSQALRQHFAARTAGRTPPPRIKQPVVSGPHRLGDSGYSFMVKQDRSIPGAVAVQWTPSVPPAGVLDTHIEAYQRVIESVLPAIANNMPTRGAESWL